MQANYVIEDLNTLSPDKFGFSQAEFDNLKAQCRVLRAWFYIRLLDAFRNVPLAVSYNDVSMNTETQVEPKRIFDFIETELQETIPMLTEKTSLGTNSTIQGQWTKASAAALLVRLYLNAKVYIGEEKYDECAAIAQKIVDGDYGKYAVADRWDAAFDWDNDNCDSVSPLMPVIPIGNIRATHIGGLFPPVPAIISTTPRARQATTTQSMPLRQVMLPMASLWIISWV